MEQIVFFTQFQKLRAIQITVSFTENGYLEINDSEGLSNRILIIDETLQSDISGLLAGYTNYFVYHNLTLVNEAYKTIIDSTPATNKLEDHHIDGDTKIYHEIKNILTGFNDEKFQELKNRIVNSEHQNNKLEAALKFLHECLGGTKPDLNLYPAFTEKEKAEISILFGVKPENMNEDLEKFRNLRDKVLDLVGINE